MIEDDRLQQALAQLEATQKQLLLLTDAVTHDLRAPLRSIESFAGLLAAHATAKLDDTERDQLQRVRDAAARMSELLDALGELSRATRADMAPAMTDVSLLAEWVAAELQDLAPTRHAAIQVQPGMLVHGDERLLKLLLAQLLHNAWKFSGDADPVRIEVTGSRRGDREIITVRDHGIGFDMRYAHKLFEPFQRLHGPEQGGGHGLGLAIAQRIAQRHGGRITADSQAGDGSTFTVELPAVVAEEDL
jgi:hypothetical protein